MPTLKTAVRALMENCIRWHITVPEGESLSELIQEIGEYNQFDPQDVIEAMNKIKHFVERTTRKAEVTIGREFSPVIYVQYKADENDGLLVQTILDTFKAAKADEYTIENGIGPNWVKIRAWWD